MKSKEKKLKGVIVALANGDVVLREYKGDHKDREYKGEPVPIRVGDELVMKNQAWPVHPHPVTGSPSIMPIESAFGVAWQPVKLFAGRLAELRVGDHSKKNAGGG